MGHNGHDTALHRIRILPSRCAAASRRNAGLSPYRRRCRRWSTCATRARHASWVGFLKNRQLEQGEQWFSAPLGEAVCPECIADEALREFVEGNLDSRECSFCRVHVILRGISTGRASVGCPRYGARRPRACPDRPDGALYGMLRRMNSSKRGTV